VDCAEGPRTSPSSRAGPAPGAIPNIHADRPSAPRGRRGRNLDSGETLLRRGRAADCVEGFNTCPSARMGPALGVISRFMPIVPLPRGGGGEGGGEGPEFRSRRYSLEARLGGGLYRGAQYKPLEQDGTRLGRHLKIHANRPSAPRGAVGRRGKGPNSDSGRTPLVRGRAVD
jgi:hypothetical protein